MDVIVSYLFTLSNLLAQSLVPNVFFIYFTSLFTHLF